MLASFVGLFVALPAVPVLTIDTNAKEVDYVRSCVGEHNSKRRLKEKMNE